MQNIEVYIDEDDIKRGYVEIDPSDYDLIDKDDAVEYVYTAEFLEGVSEDDLETECNKRGWFLDDEDEILVKAIRNSFDKTGHAKIILCDVLGLSHLVSNEQLFEELERVL